MKPTTDKAMTPGRGFRWVRVGERLKDTDEYPFGVDWLRTSWGGCVYHKDDAHRYRRRRTATSSGP